MSFTSLCDIATSIENTTIKDIPPRRPMKSMEIYSASYYE